MSAEDAIPLITVVVPSYRHEDFIGPALQSVFDQTHPRIELLVIDDASPDGTLIAAAEWASRVDADARFEGFELLSNPVNLGAHGSINRGCRVARGDYIAVLNSDDAFHPERLAKLVDALRRRSGSHLAFSRVAPIDDDGRLLSPLVLPPQLYGAFERADRAAANLPSMSHAFRSYNVGISTGNFLFTRELYERIGPFANLKYVHDWDFVLRSTLLAEPVYVAEDLYFYRLHGNNSFSQLGDVAGLETAVVFARYETAKGPAEDDAVRCLLDLYH